MPPPSLATATTRSISLAPLQPSLLDRLTDDEPGNSREPDDRRGIDKTRWKRGVLRDLAWLLNTGNAESDDELQNYPEVQRSVVNFGMRALAGARLSEIDWFALERSVRRAIIDFEPRILPATLEVKAVVPDDLIHHHNMLAFEIRCQIWAQPYPMAVLLRTSLNLESGEVVLQTESAGN